MTTNVGINTTTNVGIYMILNAGINMTTDVGICMTAHVSIHMTTYVGIHGLGFGDPPGVRERHPHRGSGGCGFACLCCNVGCLGCLFFAFPQLGPTWQLGPNLAQGAPA